MQTQKLACSLKCLLKLVYCDEGAYITQGDQGSLKLKYCLGSIQTWGSAVLRSVRLLPWVTLCKDVFVHGHLGLLGLLPLKC